MMPKSNVKGSDGREGIVYRFFKLIEDKDIDGLLDLFDCDATVYEPFSKTQGLHGRSLIEPFLKVAMMANNNMRHKIKIPDSGKSHLDGQLTALVTFELGDRAKARFIFDLEPDEQKAWKIKTLHINFLT
ncbi:hypothetical protein [Candidatus Nitrososphaera evergladensis]|uniref:hypothetical protein n=1 Tax=Candidatus Nitrososphaera evergladensis TaxID=1459637 RepID=UPI001D0468C6|nr:hypothetical protein [Candidatus Nitrososphaera evergladensis]